MVVVDSADPGAEDMVAAPLAVSKVHERLAVASLELVLVVVEQDPDWLALARDHRNTPAPYLVLVVEVVPPPTGGSSDPLRPVAGVPEPAGRRGPPWDVWEVVCSWRVVYGDEVPCDGPGLGPDGMGLVVDDLDGMVDGLDDVGFRT